MAVEVNWHRAVGTVTDISGQNVTTSGISWATSNVGDYLWFGDSETYFIITARINTTTVTVSGDISAEEVGQSCAMIQGDDAYAGQAFGYNSAAIHTMHAAPEALSVSYQCMKNQSKFIKLWCDSGAFSYRSHPGYEYDDIDFTVESGPSHGSLFDEDGVELTSFPATGTKTLCYIPTAGYTGSDSFTFTASDGLHDSDAATIALTVTASWESPDPSIPAPSFGTDFQIPTYDSANPDHYWVDADDVNSTDTANPRGSQAVPRKTIPNTLTATENHPIIVFVSSARYTTSAYTQTVTWTGYDANTPVCIVAVDRFSSTVTRLYNSTTHLWWRVSGRYFIVDGLVFVNSRFFHRYNTSPNYGCYRHCDIRDYSYTTTGTTIDIEGVSPTDKATNLVIFDCLIRDNQFRPERRDEIDVHGCGGGIDATDCWVIDNVIYHCGGDCMQFNGNTTTEANSPTRFYMAFNDGGRSLENFCDLKRSNHMFVVGNRYGGYRGVSFPLGSGSDGAATVLHDQANNVWVSKNIIIGSNVGIRANGAATVHLEGNVIRRIRGATSTSASLNGIYAFNNTAIDVVNNSLDECQSGIAVTNGVGMPTRVTGNLVNRVDDDQAHMEIGANILPTLLEFDHNAYSGTARIIYTGATRTLSYVQANSSWEANSVENSTLSVTIAATGIISIGSGSVARSVGYESPIYATYLSDYGLSLATDVAGSTRPQGGSWDIGAVEFAEGAIIIAAPLGLLTMSGFGPNPASLIPESGSLTITGLVPDISLSDEVVVTGDPTVSLTRVVGIAALPISVSLWFCPTSGQVGYGSMLALAGDGSSFIRIGVEDGIVRLKLSDGVTTETLTHETELVFGTWYSIRALIASDGQSLWVDGVEAIGDTPFGGGFDFTPRSLYLGLDAAGQAAIGYLREVGVWRSQLTDSSVAKLMNEVPFQIEYKTLVCHHSLKPAWHGLYDHVGAIPFAGTIEYAAAEFPKLKSPRYLL